MRLALGVLCLVVGVVLSQSDPWQGVDEILQEGIEAKAFPGVVSMVADEKGLLYFKAFGSFTYGKGLSLNGYTNPFMHLDVSTFLNLLYISHPLLDHL
jgi:hypothetical protein